MKSLKAKIKQAVDHGSAHVEKAVNRYETAEQRNAANDREQRVTTKFDTLNKKLLANLDVARIVSSEIVEVTALVKNISELAEKIRHRPKQLELKTDAEKDCEASLNEQATHETAFNALCSKIEAALVATPAASSPVVFSSAAVDVTSAVAASTNPFDDWENLDTELVALRNAAQSPKPSV